jgi:hypothetical protein
MARDFFHVRKQWRSALNGRVDGKPDTVFLPHLSTRSEKKQSILTHLKTGGMSVVLFNCSSSESRTVLLCEQSFEKFGQVCASPGRTARMMGASLFHEYLFLSFNFGVTTALVNDNASQYFDEHRILFISQSQSLRQLHFDMTCNLILIWEYRSSHLFICYFILFLPYWTGDVHLQEENWIHHGRSQNPMD